MDRVIELNLSSVPADRIQTRALALTFFQDERPLRGASGLIDWRMNGYVSRLLLDRRLDGGAEETTLIPSQGRISPAAVLLIGLGKKTNFNYRRITETTASVVEKLLRIDVRDFAFEIPGRHVIDLDLEKAGFAVVRGILRGLEPSEPSEQPLRTRLLDRPEGFRSIAQGVQRARSQFGKKAKIAVVQD